MIWGFPIREDTRRGRKRTSTRSWTWAVRLIVPAERRDLYFCSNDWDYYQQLLLLVAEAEAEAEVAEEAAEEAEAAAAVEERRLPAVWTRTASSISWAAPRSSVWRCAPSVRRGLSPSGRLLWLASIWRLWFWCGARCPVSSPLQTCFNSSQFIIISLFIIRARIYMHL